MSASSAPQPTTSTSRQERGRVISRMPGVYGLDYVQVRSVRPGGWILGLVFLPDLSRAVEASGIPPGIEDRHLKLWDEVGDPVPARVMALAPGAGSLHVLEVVYELEHGAGRTLPGVLTLEIVDLPRVDPFFRRTTFALSPGQEVPDTGLPPPPAPAEPPEKSSLGYLARDYESYSQLMLDRLRLTAPAWQERHAADLGVMLVELMAYAADYLTYYQDAVAAEAYLGTAQQRESLRRHARLLDYPVNDGCNARALVHVEVDRDLELPAGTRFVTGVEPDWYEEIPEDRMVFESLHPARLLRAHNSFVLAAWHPPRQTLEQGATEAILVGHWPELRAGMLLVLEELRDPWTGERDALHRHTVRLACAGELLHDPVLNRSLTRIKWVRDDALPFPLMVGHTELGAFPLAQAVGNLVLAEEGRTQVSHVDVEEDGQPRIHLPLRGLLVGSSEPYDEVAWRKRPASELLFQGPRQMVPSVTIHEARPDRACTWTPRRDLLSSGGLGRHFVAQVNDNDALVLRFGDGRAGRPLTAGSRLEIRWRASNGPLGNVGPDAIGWIVDAPEGILGVRNPLPAAGGAVSETPAQIVREATLAFRVQDRCVTEEDYATLARKVPRVREAAASFAWNGSWNTAVVHVLPTDAWIPDEALRERLRRFLGQRSMAGVDVEVVPPRYVPLAIELRVGLRRGHVREAVIGALEEELGSGELSGGRTGLFHRSHFGFGQPAYLAPVIARAAEVPGVEWVEPLRFARWGEDAVDELAGGRIAIGPTEIVQVRGDPSRPDLGCVTFVVEGGQ